MVVAKTYLIQVEEGDLESLFDRCLEKAQRKRATSIPVSIKQEADEAITPEETAQLLKVSKVTVWDWTKRGILKKYTIGNQVRYMRSEVMGALTKKGGGVTA
ncbi:helix-turn-helix domain-containing protein [Spirosoma endophyticum]|uniref:DNA binding domain-containing protein, excisionase family n=1 Tax=Spirosoma endophyticum TaxID=662367 RepID=A0A1I2G2U3_9BACT|nr:helix-turn-helix domain-containing protein [Spirosoma endophyticum]SFF11945.1 DNA binding domain-containing protein, excisionase family [Spirosoma endophyticum]